MTTNAPIKWLGFSSVYTVDEREILAALPLREQTFLHVLKAMTDGEISSKEEVAEGPNGREPWAPAVEEGPVSTLASPSVYIDAEEIPFGDPPKRKRPVYALCWTWKQHRIVKTKGRATRSMRAWKKWYERQGWKVSSHATGYFAALSTGERHTITLHEYDPITKERL